MKKVVSATLAGALAVGMVPAMALADDSVELQVAEEKYDVAKGTVTGAVDYAGNAVDLTEDVVFTATDKDNGKAIVKITEFKTATGTVVNMADTTTAADYTVKYYKVGSGKAYAWSGSDLCAAVADQNWAAGEYYVTVRSNGAEGDVALALKFEVEADDIEGAYLYEAAVDAAGKAIYTDTEFAYTGENLVLGIAVDGKPLDTADYDVTYYAKGSNVALSAVKDAGSYVAEIDGKGNYDGYEEQISFDVVVADLSKAAVAVVPTVAYCEADGTDMPIDQVYAGQWIASVNNDDALLGWLDLKFVSASNGKTANLKSEPGTYTYKLFAPEISAGKANPNIVNEALVTLVRYEDTATFEYDEKAVPSKIDFEDYDEADFVAVDDKGNELASTVKYYKVTAKGDVEVSQITGYGDYKAVLVVDSAKEGYEWGGSAVLNIKVDEIEINVNENAFIKFAGKVVAKDQAVYFNGTDWADDLEFLVLDNKDKALTAGVDYDVVITDADGEVVTEMVKSGTYKIAIKENADSIYKLTGKKEISFVINKAPATAVIGDQITGIAGSQFFFQNGKAIDPIAGWVTVDGADAGTTPDAIEIPASAYKLTVTYFKAEGAKKAAAPEDIPTDFSAAGEYQFTIADADGKDDYIVTPGTYDVVVSATNVFVDVAAGAWYADEVYDIATYGIMGGYGNGKFGPSDNTERQDLAVVLYRLINPWARIGSQDWENGANKDDIVLPFADANSKAYYAQAMWYCNKNGIMTGYTDGSKEFGVGDDVTREQVATTLFRVYESGLYGKKPTLLTSVLDAYVDADEISNYAVESMAWAVENGIFGVNTAYLNPGDPISRAELAAVVIRYMDMADVEGVEIGDVASIAELQASLANGQPVITLTEDIVVKAEDLITGAASIPVALHVDSDTVIDLNGFDIIVEGIGETSAAIFVDNANVQIIGEGTVSADNGYALWAKGQSVVDVDGGTFVAKGADTSTFYASGNVAWDPTAPYATINVNGGTFENESVDPQDFANVMNHGVGRVNYYGGTFSWNPAVDVTSDDKPYIVVASGYKVVDNGGSYSVVKA